MNLLVWNHHQTDLIRFADVILFTIYFLRCANLNQDLASPPVTTFSNPSPPELTLKISHMHDNGDIDVALFI